MLNLIYEICSFLIESSTAKARTIIFIHLVNTEKNNNPNLQTTLFPHKLPCPPLKQAIPQPIYYQSVMCINQNNPHALFLLIKIENNSASIGMFNQPKVPENSSFSVNGLQARLQQIVDLLYKNNAQFPKGLPSQNRFLGILQHCYNCYDQLDFIFLQYSKHPVSYLDPKAISENMHKITRVTKYLFSNFKHWIQSYSLDILKKVQEGKSFFPTEANHQPKCPSCNHYIEEIVLKDAKEEILGYIDMRQMYQQELKEELEDKEQRKPIIVKQATEYVGSVSYLTKIIKEMEDSAHSYDNLAENIERQDEKQDLAMNYLAELLTSMKRRLGQKCIYRLKKVLKNWEKNQCDDSCQKNNLKINQELSFCYVPTEAKKAISATTFKKLKDENRQLQIQNNNLIANYSSVKNNLTYLQNREEATKREIQRLNQLLDQRSVERKSLVNEQKSSKRNSANYETTITNAAKSNKIISNINTNLRTVIVQKKKNGYSKFKVQRQSRQSQTFSSGTDKTLNMTEYYNSNDCMESGDIQAEQEEEMKIQQKTNDVACQWEDLYPEQRSRQLKNRPSRNQKLKSGNNDRIAVQKIAKIIEEEDDKNITLPLSKSKDKRTSVKYQDLNSRPRPPTQKDNRLSLEESNRLKRLMEGQQKSSIIDLFSAQQSSKNQKTSVRLLESQTSIKKINLQKAAMNVRIKELNLSTGKRAVNGTRDVHNENDQYNFSKDIKKMINNRFATEGGETKKKVKKVRNILFKPQHLSIFGGVSQSYDFEKSKHSQSQDINEEQSKYLQAVKKHIGNLSNFKNSFFDNVMIFLARPYTLIDKNELEFKPVSQKELNKLLLRLIWIHKRKCEGINCEHLTTFNLLIGFL